MKKTDRLFRRVASNLSFRARELMLADGDELLKRNARTRAFVEQPHRSNPLRPAYELVREREQIPRSWFGDVNDAALRALRFSPSGVYHDEATRLARFIGPDGIIACSKSKGEHLPGWLIFMAKFEDGSELRIGPEEACSPTWEPHMRFQEARGILATDYAAMLEFVSRHMHETGARPMYRYRDPELDAVVVRHFWEHMMPMRAGIVRYGLRAATWMLEKVEPKMNEWVDKQARKGEESIEQRASVEYDGIFYTCQSCEKKTRVPFEKLGATGRCGQCGEALETTAYPLDASTSTSLGVLVREAPIPLLLDFWAGWCGPCLLSMPQVVAAAGESEGQFAIVRVNAHRLSTVSGTYGVEALPTMVRMVKGQEAARELGAKQKDAIVALGRGG